MAPPLQYNACGVFVEIDILNPGVNPCSLPDWASDDIRHRR